VKPHPVFYATACKCHHLVLLHLPVLHYCRVFPLHSSWGECEFLLAVSKIPIEPFLPRRCGCVCIYIEIQLGEGPCPEGAANRQFFLFLTQCQMYQWQSSHSTFFIFTRGRMSLPKILPNREYWVSNSAFTCDMSLFRQSRPPTEVSSSAVRQINSLHRACKLLG